MAGRPGAGRVAAKKPGRISGRTCLDLGCGLGLTALIGVWLGAGVIGIDYEPEALAYAWKNADLNDVSQPLWVIMDWREPAIATRSVDFICAGDIMYENRFVEPVFRLSRSHPGRRWPCVDCRARQGHL